MKEAVQERAVFKEKVAEIFINGKNTMTMLDINKFERHTGGAFHSVFVATGRTKAAVTAEGNKLEIAAMGAGVHGTTKRGIAAVDHFIDIFYLSFSGVESIYNFFIMVCKDFL